MNEVIVGIAPDQDRSPVVQDPVRVSAMKNAVAEIHVRVVQNQPMKKIRKKTRTRKNQENQTENIVRVSNQPVHPIRSVNQRANRKMKHQPKKKNAWPKKKC